jgi:5' nucleotidase family
MLITNSDFAYTDKMMSFAYDEYLPDGKTWRDLFDMVWCARPFCSLSASMRQLLPVARCVPLCVACPQVIIQARKPEFFNHPSMSLFEIVTQDGLMRPCFNARKVLAGLGDIPEKECICGCLAHIGAQPA